MVERFKRNHPDKVVHTDRTMDRQTHRQAVGMIPIYTPIFILGGGGVSKSVMPFFDS